MELHCGVQLSNVIYISWKSYKKKAIRCISGAKYNAHSDPIFKQLSILKFDDIYKLNVAKIMLTYVREELPTPLQSIFRFDRNTHAYNTRLHDNKYRIESKRWRTIVASQSILYQWTQNLEWYTFKVLLEKKWPWCRLCSFCFLFYYQTCEISLLELWYLVHSCFVMPPRDSHVNQTNRRVPPTEQLFRI